MPYVWARNNINRWQRKNANMWRPNDMKLYVLFNTIVDRAKKKIDWKRSHTVTCGEPTGKKLEFGILSILRTKYSRKKEHNKWIKKNYKVKGMGWKRGKNDASKKNTKSIAQHRLNWQWTHAQDEQKKDT